MFEIAFQPRDIGVDLLAIGFGVGAAFVLDEFALTVHLRDVYWTPEGRHSIEVSIVWTLLGLMLLTGISPFGIHDQTEIPRLIGFIAVAASIVLSVIVCLKGKLMLALVSIFVPPVGVVGCLSAGAPGLGLGPALLRRDVTALGPGRDSTRRCLAARRCGTSSPIWSADDTTGLEPLRSGATEPPRRGGSSPHAGSVGHHDARPAAVSDTGGAPATPGDSPYAHLASATLVRCRPRRRRAPSSRRRAS